MGFSNYPNNTSTGLAYGQPIALVNIEFSPTDLAPSWFVAPGNYSSETGKWTATVGPNVINFSGVDGSNLPPPQAVNGCPDMVGDAAYHEMIDELPGIDGNDSRATPFDSWSSSSGGRHWATLCLPKNIDAYGIDGTAYYNNAVVMADFNVFVCITLQYDSASGKFYAHYQDYIDDLTATATIEITPFVNAQGQGPLFLQARKQANGLMQIKCNASAWIDGDTGVDVQPDTAQGPCLGQTFYKGIIKTAISYRTALSDADSNKLYSWAQGYM